jgi:hypothetical protein
VPKTFFEWLKGKLAGHDAELADGTVERVEKAITEAVLRQRQQQQQQPSVSVGRGFNKPLYGDQRAYPPAAPDESIKALLDSTMAEAVCFRPVFPPQYDAPTYTYFGGSPCAPEGFVWPTGTTADGSDDGRPLTFLAQVDCGKLPGFASRAMLPERLRRPAVLDRAGRPPGAPVRPRHRDHGMRVRRRTGNIDAIDTFAYCSYTSNSVYGLDL